MSYKKMTHEISYEYDYYYSNVIVQCYTYIHFALGRPHKAFNVPKKYLKGTK